MQCDCCFCGDSRFKFFESIGLPSYDSIIFEDENLLVTPDLVPVTCGHLLIITKRHISCFGEADIAVLKSLDIVKAIIKEKIFHDKTVLFFEHGAVVEHSGGSCIDHAHLHVLPQVEQIDDKYIDNFIKQSGFVSEEKEEGTKEVLNKFYCLQQPYLYYELNREKWVYPVDRLPSQFFRMMFQPYMDFNYNWKISYNAEKSKQLFHDTLRLVGMK